MTPMTHMTRMLDRMTALLAQIGAWAYFAIGLMLCYEVTARYVFNAPTIWATEIATLAMIWGTFLGAAALLHRGQHIRIGIVIDRLPCLVQHRIESVLFLLIAIFSAVVVWYGTPIAYDSFATGRTTGSMLDVPTYWSEAAVPVGFAFLGLQALVEAVRALRRGAGEPPAMKHTEIG